MNFFCTKCRINWAKLATQHSGDESCDVCPKCNTDMFLDNQRPGPKFIMKLGRIVNELTGHDWVNPYVPRGGAKIVKPFNVEEWRAKKAEREEFELARLKHYTDVFETSGAEAAHTAFFNFKIEAE